MSAQTAAIREALAALDAAWADLGEVTALPDEVLTAVNERVGDVRRRVDGLHAKVAAEVASRSRPELGADGLARRSGHRTPAKLVAAATGGHTGDAARLIQVGRAIAPRTSLIGEVLPAAHPHVAAAVEAGRVSVAAAAAIVALLDKLPPRVGLADRHAAEQSLAAHAAMLTLDELQAVLRRAEAVLDPDGLEPVVAELRAERSLKISHDASGMTVLSARLDPETAAPIVAAIQGIVTRQLRTSRGQNRRPADSDAGAATLSSTVGDPALGAETRSIPQLNADALSAIARHAIGCDDDAVPGASTTVIVRMTLDQLRPDASGTATIDGLEQPIDAGAARRAAASAGVIPLVLGGESQALDLGRERRAFSASQRLVLAERDGGCASCHLPPAFCEAHHLTPWSRGGRTDLDEGILLCTSCHHRVHDDGWQIRIDRPPGAPPHAGTVWFVPPAHVDIARTPRLGGRRRFDPLAWGLTA